MSQNQDKDIIKDIVNPYFEKVSDNEYKCTVYGPTNDVNELRELIQKEVGIDLPEGTKSFNFVVK